MMDVIRAREAIETINQHQVGFGLAGDSPARAYVNDLKLKAQIRDLSEGAEPKPVDVEGLGLTWNQGFSTDETEIDEDSWYTPEGS